MLERTRSAGRRGATSAKNHDADRNVAKECPTPAHSLNQRTTYQRPQCRGYTSGCTHGADCGRAHSLEGKHQALCASEAGDFDG